jgi:hypothetical protein
MILDRSTENIKEIVWSDINAVLNEIADYYLRKFENPNNIREALLRQFEGAVTSELSGINLEDYIRTNNCSLELVAKYNKLLKIKSDFYGGLIDFSAINKLDLNKNKDIEEEKKDLYKERVTTYLPNEITNEETGDKPVKEEITTNDINEDIDTEPTTEETGLEPVIEQEEKGLEEVLNEIIEQSNTTGDKPVIEQEDTSLEEKQEVEHKTSDIEGYIKVLDEAIKERDKKEVVHATIDPNATMEEIEEDYSAISELLGDEDIVIKFKESE